MFKMVTTFYGKNICNLFSNMVINYFSSIDENHLSDIKVTFVGHFYILTGKTSIKKPSNYSEKFNHYMDDISDIRLEIKVIDLIEYNTIPLFTNNININLSHKKNELMFPNLFKDKELQGCFEINDRNNIIYTNNKLLYKKIIEDSKYSDYKLSLINDEVPFVSDNMFGLSLNSKKLYEIYLKYISYNLFEKQLCNEITYSLHYEGDLNDLNWETLSFDIECKNSMTSISWIKSLILDLFDFNPVYIKKHLSLDNKSFENELLSNDRCWMLRDKTKDMILL